MESKPNVSFEDTATAFAYKSTGALQKANLIFSLVNHPWISALATGFVKFAFKARLPIEGIIKQTAFDHFCGGESIERSESVIKRLGAYGVGTILDYSVEGEKSESGFDGTMEEIIRTIDKARQSDHIPFCVFKVTGLASADLLEKISRGDTLTADESSAFERIKARVDNICNRAHACGVPILIDAEESWIQDPIDQLADEMMARYNKSSAIVYNTYQMYRVDSMDNLRHDYHQAVMEGHFLGAKLVRGAYMEKERERAERNNEPSPIHPNKEATDKAFNDALEFCVAHLDRVSVMCGSHNEYSNAFLARRMEEKGLSPKDRHIWFAQLYGMSDNISFNLAKLGYNVVKYVPYGPVRSVMPYLLRRAQENTSVAGQSSRELTLIRKELKRRRG
ncbi:MAG TPA: proline dehydrogenase family protein [Chryseosolibacter sp.]|nr:proline dehydrogenase family protein [Chryseosolibacter sp.]